MSDQLKVFETAGQMARFAAAQQAVVARNIANSDTPGYRAVATSSFVESMDTGPALELRTTRGSHIGSSPATPRLSEAFRSGGAAPNGNTVSIEEEMVAGAGVQHEHDRALAVYRHALTVLRLALGK